jgi:hypothetical protein
MIKLREDQIELIEAILPRFKDDVSSAKIVRWLQNFDPNDWDLALEVLSVVQYRNADDLIGEFQDQLNQFISKFHYDSKLYICIPGELGKSAFAMAYLLRKTKAFADNNERIELFAHEIEFEKIARKKKHQTIRICVIDDFIGTGNQLNTSLWKGIYSIKAKYDLTIELYLLCPFILKGAVNRLQSYLKPENVLAGIQTPSAFNAPSPIFIGGRRNLIRKFCLRYGKELFFKTDKENPKGPQKAHPLGYEDSQALVAFDHGTPNNSLPILWSQRNGWYPIFPRHSNTRISEARKFKTETRFWLAVAYHLKITPFFSKKDLYERYQENPIDLRLFVLIRLLKQRRSIPVILQLINLSYTEYRDVLAEGIQRGVLNDDHSLTIVANEEYHRISSQIIASKGLSLNSTKTETAYYSYVPKKFRGKA